MHYWWSKLKHVEMKSLTSFIAYIAYAILFGQDIHMINTTMSMGEKLCGCTRMMLSVIVHFLKNEIHNITI